jgi:hypothetical protein
MADAGLARAIGVAGSGTVAARIVFAGHRDAGVAGGAALAGAGTIGVLAAGRVGFSARGRVSDLGRIDGCVEAGNIELAPIRPVTVGDER